MRAITTLDRPQRVPRAPDVFRASTQRAVQRTRTQGAGSNGVGSRRAVLVTRRTPDPEGAEKDQVKQERGKEEVTGVRRRGHPPLTQADYVVA